MSNVTLNHRNVCKDGFTVTNMVDAVFLDLPAPWEAVEYAKSAMRVRRPALVRDILLTVSYRKTVRLVSVVLARVLSRSCELLVP
jgi:hypothetical protein